MFVLLSVFDVSNHQNSHHVIVVANNANLPSLDDNREKEKARKLMIKLKIKRLQLRDRLRRKRAKLRQAARLRRERERERMRRARLKEKRRRDKLRVKRLAERMWAAERDKEKARDRAHRKFAKIARHHQRVSAPRARRSTRYNKYWIC